MAIILINSHGGIVKDLIALGQHYAATGAHLAVKYCASACLLMLAQVPQASICFYPDAWIGYHTKAEYSVAGICCQETTQTMKWERGKSWIARGYKSC